MLRRLLLLLACVSFGACPTAPDDDDSATPEAPPVGEGLFAAGCPEEGASFARLLASDDEAPWGEEAIAAAGDVVLGNTAAAWVIAAPGDNPRTWYHYGGVPIDAVRVDGCAQAGPDRFGVVGWLVGQLDLVDFPQSSLRMFRGEQLEIVSDGSDGGPAIVDVHGVDDRFWLVEYELIRDAYLEGAPKPLTEPYGLSFTVRYTLSPDDPVLDVQLRLTGETAEGDFIAGSLLFPADRTVEHAFNNSSIGAGGVNLSTQVPWFAAGSHDGAFAIAARDGIGARTTFSGVTGFLDLEHILEPLRIAPGITDLARYALSVGGGGTGSATAPLMDHMPGPFPDGLASAVAVEGVVVGNSPRSPAMVRIEAETDDGQRRLLDTLAVDEDGRFSGALAPVGAERWWLTAVSEGQDPSPAMLIEEGPAAGLELTLGPIGLAAVLVSEAETGGRIPARLEFERDDGEVFVRWRDLGEEPSLVPPGDYTVWISRGYEYSIAEIELTVEPGESDPAAQPVTLPRAFDTSGWASIDSHVHSEPSPDSRVLPPDRMRTGAASGLDVIVTTDHEAIVDLAWAVEEAGVGAFVQTALGSEVTAPLPEHTNAWPFPPRPDVPRGDHVKWYGHTLEGIWAAERERGAQVLQLNHSRVNGSCGFLCVIDWNRLTGEPAETDPTLLGLAADEALWSWDLDSMEVMNGLRSPFLVAGSERTTGSFEDNMAMHNLGYQVTAMAVTDAHGEGPPGEPRTYLRVDDDTPGAVPEEQLVTAAQLGAAQMSAGAFARVAVDGAGPGELVTATAPVVLDVEVQALAAVDVQHVTVLANCDEIAEVAATSPDLESKLDTQLPLELEVDAHIVVLAFGANPMPRGLRSYDPARIPRVVTSPIFVDVDGNGVFDPPGGKECAWTPEFDGEAR